MTVEGSGERASWNKMAAKAGWLSSGSRPHGPPDKIQYNTWNSLTVNITTTPLSSLHTQLFIFSSISAPRLPITTWPSIFPLFLWTDCSGQVRHQFESRGDLGHWGQPTAASGGTALTTTGRTWGLVGNKVVTENRQPSTHVVSRPNGQGVVAEVCVSEGLCNVKSLSGLTWPD